MKQILLVILLFCPIFAKKESLDDLSNLLNDPELLFELRKRFGNLLDDTIDDDDFTEPVVGCNALQGTLNGDCHFHTNESTIIKTTESIGKGATFIANVANITCARDCTAQCCSNEKCDTSVYQGKKDHNCYLFQCGQPSKCVFVQHEHYWMSSSSKEVHKSHQYTPGGTTQSHENELANLGAQDEQDSVDIPKTTKKPIMKTTKKPFPTTALTAAPVAPPELDEFCPSYTTVCADPHAVCLMQTCRCSVGYHKKNEVCRKHCRDEEFQCKEIGYGPIVTDCVHGSKVCNNKQDCDDGSDELDCPPEKDDKTAYQDSDPTSNFYNNPLYNLPYGNQPDSQYPYGFPIPGLTNQQQAGLLPTNQIYPNQIQPNGQYYYPSLTNQNAVPPQAGNQLGTQQWPFIDKSVGIGSQIYPNTNQVYQPVQQPGYLSPQAGNYVPVVQNPVVQSPVQKLPVQVRPNIQQPLQILPKQNMIQPVVQQVNPAVVNPVTQAPVAINGQPGTIIAQERGQDHNEMNKQVPSHDVYTDPPPTRSKTLFNSGAKFDKAEDTVESRNEYYDDTTVGHRLPSLSMFDQVNVGKGYSDEDLRKDSANNGKTAGRHSAEIDDDQFYQKPKTYPPATKAKTQIVSPTQSTAAGQRQSHSNSEGIPDYSWVNYDSKGPKVSGKKGSSVINNKHLDHEDTVTKQKSKLQDNDEKIGTRKPAAIDHVTKQVNNKSPIPASKYDDKTSESNYDYDLDRYPGRLSDDYPRPTNNHRPSYDRYRDRYPDNRRRPGHGSRYPYYDTGYARGRDRNQYPVWDKFRDEYYYPEDNFNGDRADIKHDLTYEDISAARPNKPGSFNKDEHKAIKPSVKPVATEAAPVKIVSTAGDKKDVPAVTTRKPIVTDAPVVVAAKQDLIDDQKAQSKSSESVKKIDEIPSESNADSVDNDSNSAEDSESNNETDSSQDVSNADKPFRFLNADTVEVDTYTDNSQGPIVALALGLSITMMLLIFVGCRLRTVKRRLRKGRALHSNEADYLINGMYL